MSTKYEIHKRWRKKHPQTRNLGKARNYDRGAGDRRNGKKLWGSEEDMKITAVKRPTDRVLAVELGRSVRAIQIRRSRIGC